MYDILYPSPRLVNMAQNKQKEVEILSLQEFENFIGNLRKIMSGGSRYNQHVFEHNIAEVIKNGMEVIQQIKSKIGSQSGEQQVMHTPDQRRMEDKYIQVPTTEEKKSDKKVVKEKHHNLSLLQEELRTCRNDLETKDREIESLIERLARFNDMQTKRDQRNAEDTLSLNRPSIVEGDFKDLKSEERVDALIIIKDRYKNEIDVSPERLSCIIFEAIYEHVLETRSFMVAGCKELTKFAVKEGPSLGSLFLTHKLMGKEVSADISINLHKSGSDYPREVMDSLLLAIKESASELDVDKFTKDYFLRQMVSRCQQKVPEKRFSKKIPWERLLRDLTDYVKKLIKLTWRMVTQVPPLRLEYSAATFNNQYHKMAEPDREGKEGKDREKPVCYLWPGLVDGGGRVISVGEVTPLHCN